MLGLCSCGMTVSTGDGARFENMVLVAIVLAFALRTGSFLAWVITA